MPDLMNLPLDQVEASEFALREVDQENPDVLRMFDSIAADGVLTPIRVRPTFLADQKTNKTTKDGRLMFSVIDGLHRFTGAVLARHEKIPAMVVSATDAEVERQQFLANIQRIPTKPYEYGKHLRLILGRDQTRTRSELAAELHVSEGYIDQRMGLTLLHKDGVDAKGDPTSTIGRLVDEGKIPLANAIELARLKPTSEQLAFVEDAITMPTLLFANKVKTRIKELADAKRAGRDPNVSVGFSACAHLRKKQEIEAEAKTGQTLAILLRAKGISDVVEAARFALNWAVQLDEQSVSKQKADHDAREQQRVTEIAERKAERLAKASAEAKAAASAVAATVNNK